MMRNEFILKNTKEIELDKNYSIEETIELINDQVRIVRLNLEEQKEDLNESYNDLSSQLKDIEISIKDRLNVYVKDLERYSKYQEQYSGSLLRLDLSLTEFSIVGLLFSLTNEDDILLEEVDLLRDYVCYFKRILNEQNYVELYEDFTYSSLCSNE